MTRNAKSLASAKSTDRSARLREKVRPFYESQKGAHGWDHILRVKRWARILRAGRSDVDAELLEAMVLLHDVVRAEGEDEEENAERSAQIARELLEHIGYTDKEISHIVHGIMTHSLSSNARETPLTAEARVLFDSDKLDAVGLVGVSRWLMTMGHKNATLAEASQKYLDLLRAQTSNSTKGLSTTRARALAAPGIAFAALFFGLLKRLS